MSLSGGHARARFLIVQPDEQLTGEDLVIGLYDYIADPAYEGDRDLDFARQGFDQARGDGLPALVAGRSLALGARFLRGSPRACSDKA